jgi:hypothetical protein
LELSTHQTTRRGRLKYASPQCVRQPHLPSRDANTIDKDARLFFALNGALLDASISAWDAKRFWNSVRPITAVRWLRRGQTIQAWGGPYQGAAYIKGEGWLPYQPADDLTPASAEYASAHATFSCAAAEVLTAVTGRGNFELQVTIPAGSSKVEPKTATQPGVPAQPITLSWTNFRYAAGPPHTIGASRGRRLA